LPRGEIVYEGYYNNSPECWGVCTEVLGREFQDPLLFRQVHQLTVDAYAVQHPGGAHPDKSMDIHLVGLHLVLDLGLQPTDLPPRFQRLAKIVEEWPHFDPPEGEVPVTVGDVAAALDSTEHAKRVHEWAGDVWGQWSEHHESVRDLALKCHG